MSFPIPKRYQKRASRKNLSNYAGGLPEVLVWEEYFELRRRRMSARYAFALGVADTLGGKYANPNNAFFHPIRWRAYEFGRRFVQFFSGQAREGHIKAPREFFKLHLEFLGVMDG